MGNEIIDESVYLRVTTPLARYSGYDKVPIVILNNAADRGQRVHTYCRLYAHTMLFGDIDSDCFEYVQAFIEWFDKYVEIVHSTEQRLFCDSWKIQGQPDLIAKLNHNPCPFGYTLVDIKTSLNSSKTWDLQTAAYKHLCTENNIPIEERVIVHLHKDGTYDMIEYKDYERKANNSRKEGDAETKDQYLEHLSTYGACLKAHRFFS